MQFVLPRASRYLIAKDSSPKAIMDTVFKPYNSIRIRYLDPFLSLGVWTYCCFIG